MKTFTRRWRALGIVCFIYLDDILIFGPSKAYLNKMRPVVLKDLQDAGLVINFTKSLLEPVQQLEALGLELDMRKGLLLVPHHKRKGYRREAGKFLTMKVVKPRKVAAILGRFRSLLPTLPALRAFSDLLVAFVNRHAALGWDVSHPVPQQLRDQVVLIKELLTEWPGRPFLRAISQHAVHLASDATPIGWGGLDLKCPSCVVHDFWQFSTHINNQELAAAIHTTMSLARPRDFVLLDIDSSVAFSYLSKSGGKVARLNALLRPFL